MTQNIQTIINDLPGKEWWDRRKAISRLLEFPETEFTDTLTDALRNHADADVRNSAMEVFTALGERALPTLCALTRDEDPEVRLFSVNLLGQIGSLKALSTLCETIRDTDENVRIASAEALGQVGDAGALQVLQAALGQDAWIAMAALHAIGNIGGSSSLDILHSCLEREDLREFAVAAIELAGNVTSFTPLLGVIGSSEHVPHRELALNAVVAIADRDGTHPDAERLREFIPFLLQTAEAGNPQFRRSALVALSWSGDSRGLPLLLTALGDEDLQESAIEGLLAIGPDAAPTVAEYLVTAAQPLRGILAKLLSMLGATSLLLQFVRDEDPLVRTEVALAMGSLRSAACYEELTSMLSDPSDDVRLAARKSLESYGHDSSSLLR